MGDIREDRIIMTAPGVWTTPVVDTTRTPGEKWWNQPGIRNIRYRRVLVKPGKKVRGPVHPVGGPYTVTQGVHKSHLGIDFGGKMGTPIVSFDEGTVTRIQRTPESGYGLAVFVQDVKTGFEITYGHLQTIGVKIGQVLAPGEQLGTMGSTGASSGPHLHFEMGKPGAQPFYGLAHEAGAVDPRPYLEQVGMAPMAGLIPGPAAGSSGFSIQDAINYPLFPDYSAPDFSADTDGYQDERIYDLSSRFGSRPPNVELGGSSSPIGTDPERESTASDSAAGMFAPIERIAESAGEGIKRAGFMTAGMFIMLLGLILLAYSYRDTIGSGAKTAVKAGTTIAAPEAAPVIAAVA